MIQCSRLLLAVFSLVLLQAPSPGYADQDEGPEVFGWIEPVLLVEAGFKLDAKLDSGADHSSLGAHNIRRVRVGEASFVRFSVRHPKTHELISLRLPYIRSTRIRSHTGVMQRRRVVAMKLCLGGHLKVAEVNLVNRSEFDYRLLVGRSYLEGIALIDPSVTHLSRPHCENQG